MTDGVRSRGLVVLLEQVTTMVRRSGRGGITWERAVSQVRYSSRVGRPKAVDALGALVEAGLVQKRGNVLVGAPPQSDEAAAITEALAAFKRRRARRLTGARG